MCGMNLLRFISLGIILTFLASSVFAWGFVAETWNSNQVYAGSFYQPSSAYSGFVYNTYHPNAGYPVMGGGSYYPYGYPGNGYYYAGGYNYPSFVSPSYPGHYVSSYYYGAPVHSTLDYGYGYSYPSYGNCTSYYC